MASGERDLFAAIAADDVVAVLAIVDEDPALALARDEHGVSALMTARYRMDMALTDAVLRRVPSLDVFEAAAFGDVDRPTAILDQDPAAVSMRSGDGFTALHFAAFFGGPSATAFLVARGADVDAAGTGWMTGAPLHSAASASQTDSAAELLRAGADANARQAQGWTPLHSAAANGLVDLVRDLLAHDADPTLANGDGKTPADVAADDSTRDALG